MTPSRRVDSLLPPQLPRPSTTRVTEEALGDRSSPSRWCMVYRHELKRWRKLAAACPYNWCVTLVAHLPGLTFHVESSCECTSRPIQSSHALPSVQLLLPLETGSKYQSKRRSVRQSIFDPLGRPRIAPCDLVLIHNSQPVVILNHEYDPLLLHTTTHRQHSFLHAYLAMYLNGASLLFHSR